MIAKTLDGNSVVINDDNLESYKKYLMNEIKAFQMKQEAGQATLEDEQKVSEAMNLYNQVIENNVDEIEQTQGRHM